MKSPVQLIMEYFSVLGKPLLPKELLELKKASPEGFEEVKQAVIKASEATPCHNRGHNMEIDDMRSDVEAV